MAGELTILLGGSAGQGLQTMGQVISRSLSRLGFHIFALQDYESRIRGGHTFFQLRAAQRRVDAHVEVVDIVVALDEETLLIHQKELAPHGIIIYDSDKIKKEYTGEKFLPLKLTSISQEETGVAAMANTVALGAVWSIIGLDIKLVEEVLDSFFGGKSKEIVEKNVKVARIGYELGAGVRRKEFSLQPPGGARRLVLSGTEAAGLGAIASDVRFYSAYPMTPATGVMEFIMKYSKKYGIVVEQAEDEISALNMAIASSFMGVRSMVGTSGGGFSLMVEALGLAGIVEIPVVIYEAQRPGPATGMPTRTEQGDLLFTIFASQDEFPRVVLAPTTPESAFKLTVEAFNLADRLQTPVIILSDHHLASCYWTVDDLPTEEVTLDRGVLASEEELASGDRYLRYRLTDSGVSPRAWPGQGTALVVSSGDEHDESGHITEEPELRKAMVDKRWKKLELIDDPGLEADIQKGADTVLIGWGSTYGALREAVQRRREEGDKISLVQLYRLWPFPGRELKKLVDGHGKLVVAENNSLGQLARLIRMETGLAATDAILRYDGRPFSVDQILNYFS
jgi:2-oxoglutarate ferredoxin oxidoreductase subunit alpha